MSAAPDTYSFDWKPVLDGIGKPFVAEADLYVDGQFVRRAVLGKAVYDVIPGVSCSMRFLSSAETSRPPRALRARRERQEIKAARRKRGARR